MKPSVTIRIDELVLRGVRPGDRHRVAGAITAELTRLLTERGVPSGLARTASLDRIAGNPVRVPPRSSPRLLGQRLAGALYSSLDRPR
jgi:hypothetical protein